MGVEALKDCFSRIYALVVAKSGPVSSFGS